MAIDMSMHLELQDMLVNYFKQRHFNKMPENVRAKFDEYVKNDDLVGHMKDWKSNLWVDGGTRDPKDAIKDISDDDLIQLYKDIRARLQRLNQMRSLGKLGNLDDKHPATKFLERYFGADSMFHESSVDGKVKATIEKFFNSDNDNLKIALNFGLSAVKKSANDTNNKYTIEELKNKIKAAEYNTDPEFRKDLYQILRETSNNFEYDYYNDPESRNIKYELSQLLSGGFDPNPSKSEIDSFRDELPDILNQVYSSKKLRDTIFANSEIVSAFNTARDEVDYDKKDSECFVEGKTDDQLTFMQLLKKEVTDKYEDYLEKYLHGGYDHLYKSPEAKEIMGAIKKVGIKKTDGLDKILEKANDIKTKAVAKMKKAGPHMNWLVDELTKLKKDMPEAFAGCLNNGFQLSRIIQQLIMDAVEQDKTDEAQTVMELLVVLQYGNTTSGLMEKIRDDKELFTLFSNKDLSWNKNEGVKIVTSALDKTFRVGGLAIGYGVTFVYNKVRQLGAQIKDKDGNKFFQAERDKWADNNEEKASLEDALSRTKGRVKKYRDIVGLRGSGIRSKKDKEDFYRTKEAELTLERDTAEANFLTPDYLTKTLDNLENNLIGKVTDDIINLGQDYIQKLRIALNNNVPINNFPPIPNELLMNPETSRYFIRLQNLFEYDKQNHQEFEQKQDEINRFREATDELKRAEAQRDKYRKQLHDFDVSKKNKFDKLVKYWNDLLNGSRKFGEQQNWFGSTKDAQKAYFETLKARAA